MMREIKFRAKSIATPFKGTKNNIIRKGDWVYGNVINDGDDSYIVNGVVECNDEYISIEEWCPVDTRTVCQYTGLKDENGVEIYERDVVAVEICGYKYDEIVEILSGLSIERATDITMTYRNLRKLYESLLQEHLEVIHKSLAQMNHLSVKDCLLGEAVDKKELGIEILKSLKDGCYRLGDGTEFVYMKEIDECIKELEESIE